MRRAAASPIAVSASATRRSRTERRSGSSHPTASTSRNARSAQLYRFGTHVFGVSCRVLDVHRAPLEHGPTCQCTAARRNWIACLEIPVFRRDPERCNHATEAVVQPENEAGVCPANIGRRLDQRIQHWPELGTRLADDL